MFCGYCQPSWGAELALEEEYTSVEHVNIVANMLEQQSYRTQMSLCQLDEPLNAMLHRCLRCPKRVAPQLMLNSIHGNNPAIHEVVLRSRSDLLWVGWDRQLWRSRSLQPVTCKIKLLSNRRLADEEDLPVSVLSNAPPSAMFLLLPSALARIPTTPYTCFAVLRTFPSPMPRSSLADQLPRRRCSRLALHLSTSAPKPAQASG
uniref:Uncharacterized protein n=1 Tax=Mycena chlorophos TaxID=658473 RepID=A0ABQ0LBL4_MYCCL|nr:predicted protein [Mycena chlorophos]